MLLRQTTESNSVPFQEEGGRRFTIEYYLRGRQPEALIVLARIREEAKCSTS
jgi:hypothetical protein